MNPRMYIFANRGLGMSPGKLAAQVAHAAVEAYLLSDPELITAWRVAKHYPKLVMLAEDEQHLSTIQDYLEARDFATAMIIDEGRTEIRPFSKTALGVAIVDKDVPEVAAVFDEFKLYTPRDNGLVYEGTYLRYDGKRRRVPAFDRLFGRSH